MTEQPTLHRALGRPAAIAMVLGSVIGSGIFFMPHRVAAKLGSFEWVIAVWVLAGVLCLLGALSLAELAAMIPRAGGLYVYLKEAYGKLVAFLYGWSLFLVVRPAATGALATAFPKSMDIPDGAQYAISIGVIALLAWINVMGVVWGGRMQNATAGIKAGFLLIIALIPWFAGAADVSLYSTVLSPEVVSGAKELTEGGPGVGAFIAALLAVMFAYNSWHEVTPLAEEIKDPQRNVPWALIVGVSLLVLLYVGANLAYHSVLTMDEVAQHENSATEFINRIFGSVGESIMAALVMCSVFGTLNANLLHAPRVYFAMGRDGVFFPQLGWVHAVRRTPMVAILSQAALACVMIVVARAIDVTYVFHFLTNIVVFGGSIFYLLAVLAVVVLRRTQPDRERPYRTLGYPFVPLLFVGAYACFLPGIFMDRHVESWIGIGVIALGVPAYFLWNRRR